MNIEIPSGDTYRLHINVTDGWGNEYELKENDILRFTVRKTTSHKDGNPVLFQSEGADINMPSSVTETLKEGNYVYDVELTQEDGTYRRLLLFVIPVLLQPLARLRFLLRRSRSVLL